MRDRKLPQSLKTKIFKIGGNMNGLLEKRRKRRMDKTKNSKILNSRTYNTLLGIVILYGLVLNYILCAYGLEFAMSINPVLLKMGYLILGFVGIIISIISERPSVSFIGYNLLVIPSGLVLTLALQEFGGIDSTIVKQAFLYTTIISGIMVLLGNLYPKFFEKMGGMLFAALIGLIITRIIAFICNFDNVAISWIAAIIYSLYIGYDIYKSQKLSKTIDNAIECAIDLYLDIFGVFINLLDILDKENKR